MANLQDVLAYILKKYPYRSELSNARVTKLVYLSDWKFALDHGGQISPVQWYFDNYGPFVWDIKDAAEGNPFLFEVEESQNIYGSSKTLLRLKDETYEPDSLTPEQRATIDSVIESTKSLNFRDFINFVYSTYPVLASQRYSQLDLSILAEDYRDSSLYKSGASA